MIKVSALAKRFNTDTVLKGVSFEVPAGGLAAVLGPSGCGKSTLLRCLIGLEAFDLGTVEVGAVVLRGGAVGRARADEVRALRQQMGLVFQSLELFPHLTALQNCVLPQVEVRKTPPAQAAEKARALLEQLGLKDRVDAFPEHLSGGQRQRVAIARALAMEPRVLLYDEPTSALDPSFKREVVQAIQRVKETGVTQVVVTHDVQLARSTAEQIFILDQGRIVESGAANQVLDHPQHECTVRLLSSGP